MAPGPILERYLAEQNIAIHDFTAYTEIGSVHLIKELAVKGCGITFLYENTAKREIARRQSGHPSFKRHAFAS